MQSIKTWRFIVLFVLIALAGGYVYTRAEVAVPVNQPLNEFPQRAGDWMMTGQARFDERVLAVLLPTDYLSRSYANDADERVSLYIGYHGGGPDSGPIHSPKQCLPGSGWNRLHAESRDLQVANGSMSYVQAVYQKDLQKQMFLYWFQVRDQFLTNEYVLKLAMAKNSFLSNRRDSSFIRLSIMVDENEAEARRIGEDFIQAFLPAIREYLPD